jgi:predicted metalloprotease
LTDADVTDILRAAAVVGDDFQRNIAGAELAPETWTHGSSEQRVHWVSVGKSSGRPGDCDTFAPS